MTDRRPAARPATATLGALLLLAACGEGRDVDASPESGPGGYNMVDPVEAEAAPGTPGLTPGTWQPASVGGAAAVRFVSAQDGEPLFRLVCDDRGGIFLDRLGDYLVGEMEMMDVQVGSEGASLALNPVEGEAAVLRAEVPFNGALLAPMREPRGRLSVKAGDTERLEMPLNPQTAAFAEGCREAGGGTQPDGTEAGGNAAGNAAGNALGG